MAVITMEELAKFNGKDGAKAYIAYNEKVYDVSGIFEDGEHMGCEAGTDITGELDEVPHGTEVLEQANLVGDLA